MVIWAFVNADNNESVVSKSVMGEIIEFAADKIDGSKPLRSATADPFAIARAALYQAVSPRKNTLKSLCTLIL